MGAQMEEQPEAVLGAVLPFLNQYLD